MHYIHHHSIKEAEFKISTPFFCRVLPVWKRQPIIKDDQSIRVARRNKNLRGSRTLSTLFLFPRRSLMLSWFNEKNDFLSGKKRCCAAAAGTSSENRAAHGLKFRRAKMRSSVLEGGKLRGDKSKG